MKRYNVIRAIILLVITYFYLPVRGQNKKPGGISGAILWLIPTPVSADLQGAYYWKNYVPHGFEQNTPNNEVVKTEENEIWQVSRGEIRSNNYQPLLPLGHDSLVKSIIYIITKGLRGGEIGYCLQRGDKVELLRDSDEMYLRINGPRVPSSHTTELPKSQGKYLDFLEISSSLDYLRVGGFYDGGCKVELSSSLFPNISESNLSSKNVQTLSGVLMYV